MRYERRSEAEHAIGLVRGAPGNGCRFAKVRRAAGAWYWHLKSPNGKVLTRGDGVPSEVEVDRAIALAQLAGRGTAVRSSDDSEAPVDDAPAPAPARRTARPPALRQPGEAAALPPRLRVHGR